MENTRTKNVVLIAFTSVIRQFLNIITQFISRTVFIYVLGAEYLGLNGLFSNILSLLSLAELGIGSAISFYLYKPIAENDKERIKTLLSFYKVCYRVIGLTIIVIGLMVCPILPRIVNFKQNVPVNLYLVYVLYLLNIAMTYLVYAYKQALPLANQEQYKIEKLNMLFVIFNCLIDVVILLVFKNYVIYLWVKLLLVILKNIVIANKIDKEYPYIKEKTVNKIRNTEMKVFFADLKNVALFKIGSTLYNSTDNIIVSKMLGTIVVGYYSNYFLVISSVTTFVGLLVKAFTASIGNLVVNEDKENQYKYYMQIDFIAYLIVAISSITLYQLLNSFIGLWVGRVDTNYILSQSVVLFLCISFYLDGTTQIMNTFREATGHFKIGRNFQIIGGILNIFLSIALGKVYGLEGIFASTVICKLLVSLCPFTILISCHVFNKGYFTILIRYLTYLFATIGVGICVWIINIRFHMTSIGGFLLETILTIVASTSLLCFVFCGTEAFQQNYNRVNRIIKKK